MAYSNSLSHSQLFLKLFLLVFTSISLTYVVISWLCSFRHYQFIFPRWKMKILFLFVPMHTLSYTPSIHLLSIHSSTFCLLQLLGDYFPKPSVFFPSDLLFCISVRPLSSQDIHLLSFWRFSLLSCVGFPVSWIVYLPIFWCTPSFSCIISSSSFLREVWKRKSETFYVWKGLYFTFTFSWSNG